MSLKLYKIFCILRLIFILIPQIGYIHPDEHFQGPEVVYGDILDLKVLKTWDFTAEKPIRSIVFPYLVTAPVSLILSTLGMKSLQETTYLPYLLLILPRIVMCCISFLNDILLHKLCCLLKIDSNTSLTLFASSYVALVYLTRTFSNCLEVVFFSLVIYLTWKLMHLSSDLGNTKKSAKGHKHIQTYKITRNLINVSFMLGLAMAMGIFNRPTFLCFVLMPSIILLLTLLKMKKKLQFIASFLLGGISITLSFISIDSLYYNKTHFSSVHKLIQNVTVTPLNFILYNTNKSNLDSHGLHPHWLHVFVNIPLLYSIYGVFIMLDCLIVLKKLVEKPRLDFKCFLVLSFTIPLLLLSLIPHQEPRFLLPLIFPLALLLNSSYYYKFLLKGVCLKFWYFSNFCCVLFYGFFHQGGVYRSSHYIHSVLSNNTDCAVVFYKTYMPPRYLLGLDQNQENVKVYDFAGVDFEHFSSTISSITVEQKPSTVYVVTIEKLVDSVLNIPLFRSKYKIGLRNELFPHLSTEHLPRLSRIKETIFGNNSLSNKLYDIQKMFSIHILSFNVS